MLAGRQLMSKAMLLASTADTKAGMPHSCAVTSEHGLPAGRQLHEQEELAAVQAVRLVASLLSALPDAAPAEPDNQQIAEPGSRAHSHSSGSQPAGMARPADAFAACRGELPERACGPLFQQVGAAALGWLSASRQLRADVTEACLVQAAGHDSPALRAAAHGLPAACPEAALWRCTAETRAELLRRVTAAATADAVPHVRAAAGKAVAQLAGVAGLISSEG